jgi:hypothetical protein
VVQQADAGVVEIWSDDPDDFDALYTELRGVGGITVEAVPAPMEPSEQGSVVDLLTVACSGGAITVFLQIIKTLLDSRGPSFALKMRRGKDRLEITSDSIDDVAPLIKELLNEP